MSVDEEVNTVEEQPSSGLGEMLRQAREQAGYSQQDVAKELHLKLEIIQGMDDELLDELPEPAYVRGYLRSYARLIGLDPEVVLETYSKLKPETPEWEFNEPAKHEVAQGRSLTPVTVTVFVIILGLLVTWLLTEGNGGKDSKDEPVVVAEVPASIDANTETVVEMAQPVEAEVLSDVTPEPETTVPLVDESPVQEELVVLEQEVTEEVTVAEDSLEDFTLASVQADGADSVVLTFNNESWAEVIDANGVQLLRGLMKKNSVQQLSGTAPFSVFLGNTPAVEIRINNVVFDATPYMRRDSVSRFTLTAQ
jgi:cytoskeleton protein RodZ